MRDAVGVFLSSFHNVMVRQRWTRTLLTVQDADPSEEVTVIVDEDAVDGRRAGWLVVTFLDVPAAVLL